MRHETHFLPLSQITSGKPVAGESPTDLASLLEWQVGRATDASQKVTITMSLRDATSLAKLLRRAGLAGL